NNNPWTSAAELNVQNSSGVNIPHSGWSLKYVDSQDPSYPATNAFDANTASFWHTLTGSSPTPQPHEIQISLGSVQTLSGFSYLPRQDACSNGWVKQYEFYVSSDGVNWGTPVASGSFDYTGLTATCPGASVPTA